MRQWRYAVCPAEVTRLVVVLVARRKVGGDGDDVVEVDDGGHGRPTSCLLVSKPKPSEKEGAPFWVRLFVVCI